MVDEKFNKVINLIRFSAKQINKADEISRLKGENFNIFSILGLESAENKTHSAFIGELLSPEGSHGMHEVFLELFIKQLHTEKFIIKGASVKLEYDIGKVDKENNTGGRIDIFLEDKNQNSISIENKIYASEQEMQIPRYKKFNVEKNQLYFLTLNGKDAEKKGKLKAGKDYFLLSYRDDIKYWLQSCLKEASDRPILRETIKQYIILIKKLTGQLTSKKMKDEIASEIARNSENFKAANEVINNINGAKVKLQKRFWEELYDAINKDPDFDLNKLSYQSPEITSSKSIINLQTKDVNTPLIKEFYETKKNSKLYGLHYEILKGENKRVLSLMVDHNLWFCVNGEQEGYKDSKTGVYIFKHFKRAGDTINLKEFNDNAIDLFDDSKRKEIITDIVKQWKIEINSILK